MPFRFLASAVLTAGALAACSSGGDSAGNGGREGRDARPGQDGGPSSAYPTLPPYVADTTPLDPSYSVFDHGKDCFDRFQVEVPTFDCDGPDSSRLRVEVDGREVTSGAPERCDKPALVGADLACIPGGRVTKFSQVNKYGHTIVTVAVCRRSAPSALDSGRFDNIALIQSDLQTNEACWYQVRKGDSFVGRGLVPPYATTRKKGDAQDRRATELYESPIKLTTDESECYRCHDSNLWVKTPWIDLGNQVPARSGNDNDLPRVGGVPTHVGKAYRDWNLPRNRPAQVHIDAQKLDQAFRMSATDRAAVATGTIAPSDACTQCHTLGNSEIAGAAQGTCNDFVRLWTAGKGAGYGNTSHGARLSARGAAFPLSAWMPPGASTRFSTTTEYRAFYRRAFAAVEHCCDDPSRPGCTRGD